MGTWVITGGASGMGKHLAQALISSGDEVEIWDRDDPQLEGAHWKPIDLAETDSIEAAASGHDHLDAFVHLAGILLQTNAEDGAAHDALKTSMAVHVEAFIAGVRHLLPALESDGGGAVVAISSIGADYVYPESLAYGASKAALQRVVVQLAVELGPKFVRVNAVSPGAFHTPMTESIWSDPKKAEERKRLIPLGRAGQVEDIANLIRFLASDEASYITGATISIDGGLRVALAHSLPTR